MADVNKEKDLWVHSFRMPPDSNNSIRMEVGIEDCLHIEFEYNKSKYVSSHFGLMLSLKWHGSSFLHFRQVPSERCHRGQDLLPPRPHKDQTYGTVNHPTRDDGFTTKSI